MFSNIDFNQYLTDALLAIMTRAPKIILIIILVIVARRILRYVLRRLAKHVDDSPELISEPKKAKTLISVLNSIGKAVIYTIGTIMILYELNINIGPIIAGVGILGLAIGFGAQTLVKDFITGFFILMEAQYAVGDFIKVGDKTGTVENISLRITRIRDFEGLVHYIPNGNISEVTNYHREWNRVILDFEIPFSQDIAYVTKVLCEIGTGLKGDSKFGEMLLEQPVVTGVENLGDTSFRLRVIAKTNYTNKFDILREFRRRVKNRFDELGIPNPRAEQAVWLMDTDKKTGLAAAN
jgi:small-conductance mechanosensitive channel